jgi:mono/diheme cytochrome c family protein
MSANGSLRRPTTVAVLFALVIGALGAAEPAWAVDDVDKGRKLAVRLCAHCHMAPGQGEKLGANDIPGFVAVARRRNQSHKGIVAWLRTIPPMMPNHHLSQDEMSALAAYIMTLRRPDR